VLVDIFSERVISVILTNSNLNFTRCVVSSGRDEEHKSGLLVVLIIMIALLAAVQLDPKMLKDLSESLMETRERSMQN
jgi:hypothetical protein